jgi:general secretion pathway protein G
MALHTTSGKALVNRAKRNTPAAAPPGSPLRSGRPRRGYTLIEIIIVMAIISILVSVAVPVYQKTVLRSRESVLRNNLFSMRQVIDEYT